MEQLYRAIRPTDLNGAPLDSKASLILYVWYFRQPLMQTPRTQVRNEACMVAFGGRYGIQIGYHNNSNKMYALNEGMCNSFILETIFWKEHSVACQTHPALGTTSKVQRLWKKETHFKGGRGGWNPVSYFLSCLGDIDFFNLTSSINYIFWWL